MSDSGMFAVAALAFAGLGWWVCFGFALLFLLIDAAGSAK